jgi:hypothetical protein
LNSFSFLRQRIRHYWQVFVTLALGVVLATALLATGPVLVEAVVEFGLRRALANADPLAANLRLFTLAEPGTAVYQALNDEVHAFARTQFSPQLDQIIPSGGTRYIHPWVGSQLLSDQRVNLRFYGANDADLLHKVTFTAGAWPANSRLEENVVAVVVGEPMAHAYELQVGDRLPLSIRQNAVEPEFWLDVAGIIQPADSQDRFWFGHRSPLRAKSDARYVAQFSALIPGDDFFTLADAWFNPSEVNLEWLVLLSPDSLTFDDSPALQARLANLDASGWTIDNTGIRIDTTLPATLSAFDSQSLAVQAPLLALTATVVLLALYYVLMAAALSLQQVEREFAVLRGRGASGWQLFRLQILEGGLISLVAVISGPGLAWVFVSALSVWGPLADVRQAEWVLRLPSAAWLAAVIGSMACLASLLVPVPGMLRRSIVTHHHFLSRTNRKPWWQRFYVDVFILLAGLILLWRLQTAGSIVGGTWERPRVDWLLLLAPLALLLGAATILLRIFPFLLNVGAQLASQGRGLPAALAMWQAARNPTHIARLVLLLTLAMALGLFSTGLNTALDLNEGDRAQYATGSDFRLANSGLNTAATLPTISGVQETAVAWRNEGSLTTRIGSGNPHFDVLAIDPEHFAAASEFRPDFAAQPVIELLSELQFSPETSLSPLPGMPTRLGVWLFIPPNIFGGYSFKAKIQTAQAEYITIPLEFSAENNDGPLPEANLDLSAIDGSDFDTESVWYYFDSSLPRLAVNHFPLSLHSIWMQWRNNRFSSGSPIGVDDVTVIDENGQVVMAERFETDLNWFGVTETITTSMEIVTPHTGSSHLMLNTTGSGLQPNRWRWHGVSQAIALSESPLPALVSQGFASIAQMQVGDPVSTWVDSVPTNFEVVGIVDHFPSLYEEKDAGFLVTLREPLLAHINNIRETATSSNEIFVATTPDVTEATITAALPDLFARETQIWEAEVIRKAIKSDPLALGLRSVTLFAYILTVVLSLAAFGVYFYMSVRQRGGIYGVLRALGLSPNQLYLVLLWEQTVLIFSGLTLGTVLGLLLNRLTLPGLPINLGGRPPVPPFLVQTDWMAVGRIYLTLAIGFLALLGIAVGLLWRSKLHRVLRVGEE